MTESTGRTASSNPEVDALFFDTCRQAVLNLLTEISKFVLAHTEHFGQRPEQVVLLTGTTLTAAVSIASQNRHYLWGYDRSTGRLYAHGSRTSVLVCEFPQLGEWGVQILAPGDRTLGEPRIHAATITTSRPA